MRVPDLRVTDSCKAAMWVLGIEPWTLWKSRVISLGPITSQGFYCCNKVFWPKATWDLPQLIKKVPYRFAYDTILKRHFLNQVSLPRLHYECQVDKDLSSTVIFVLSILCFLMFTNLLVININKVTLLIYLIRFIEHLIFYASLKILRFTLQITQVKLFLLWCIHLC